MSYYNNDTIPDLQGEVWKEIDIDHSQKDYFISSYGRLKSRYKRQYFARKEAKREKLLTWTPNKRGHSIMIRDREHNQYVVILRTTRHHLMKKYFLNAQKGNQ